MKKAALFLLTTALFWVAVLPFLWRGEKKDRGEVLSLALVSESRDQLKSDAVAEWLNLSAEKFTPLTTFNLKEGAEKLLKIGLMQKVQLYKLEPSALVVSYTLREPFATVANWKNTGIDRGGHLFPLSPFFSPKELPELVFKKNQQLDYVSMVEAKLQQFPLAKSILQKNHLFFPWNIARVDLSRLDVEHPYGGEWVLTLKRGEQLLFVRLWLERYEESLSDLAKLLPKIEKGTGVDLRLSSRILVF